jgi:septal ring factor EnvC (AmiA/AmiB activator)
MEVPLSRAVQTRSFWHYFAVTALFLVSAAAQLPRSSPQMDQEMEQRQIKALNKQRQQEIRSDSDRLFELATQLKAAVDKSNENLLSLEVVRKADEVEKLAKRIKEKMKAGVGPGPRLESPPPPRIPGQPRL